MNKNMQRLGGNGGGLSFANAKIRSGCYNPSLIRVVAIESASISLSQYQKYKLRNLGGKGTGMFHICCGFCYSGPNIVDHAPLICIYNVSSQGGNETEEGDNFNRQNKQKMREEKEKARAEREAVIQSKKQEIQRFEARRRALKEKMYKKTKSGQPVMKYQMERLLETIQGSTS